MKPRIYVHLYHGRTFPEQELDDWGVDGPTLGPFDSVQVTYQSHIKMHGEGDFVELWWGHNDLIHHQGVWYGDVEILTKDEPTGDRLDSAAAGGAVANAASANVP